MITLVSVSGGLGSAYALKSVIEQEGKENVRAVFCDVKGSGKDHFWSDLPEVEILLHERFGGESKDTYEFIWQLSESLDIPIERIGDNRNIWSTFARERAFRIVSGSRYLCKASEALKREALASWIEQSYAEGDIQMALGMGFLEQHRVANASSYWQYRLGWPIRVYSPIATKEFDNCLALKWLDEIGISPPIAYQRNLPHNNCGGICVQAGLSQWAEIYKIDKERYQYAQWQEMRLRTKVGIRATILRDRRGNITSPMTLEEFAPRIELDDYRHMDLGGSCSCFTSSLLAHEGHSESS